MELELEQLPPGCVAVKALRGKSAAFVLMAEPYYPLLGDSDSHFSPPTASLLGQHQVKATTPVSVPVQVFGCLLAFEVQRERACSACRCF